MGSSKVIGTNRVTFGQLAVNTTSKVQWERYISPMMLFKKHYPNMASIKKATNSLMKIFNCI